MIAYAIPVKLGATGRLLDEDDDGTAADGGESSHGPWITLST